MGGFWGWVVRGMGNWGCGKWGKAENLCGRWGEAGERLYGGAVWSNYIGNGSLRRVGDRSVMIIFFIKYTIA